MPYDAFDDNLTRQGYRWMGGFDHRLTLAVWWHPEHAVQVLVVPLGDRALLKASKSYDLLSISEGGETWARDIGPLQDYLESTFPELRLHLSHFRDITGTLAARHIERRQQINAPTQPLPDVASVAELQDRLERQRRDRDSLNDLIRFGTGTSASGMLGSYVKQQARAAKRSVRELKQQTSRATQDLHGYESLQRAYLRDGSATCLSFTICSNLHVVAAVGEFDDALRNVTKELLDAHRYQITQKLNGGRLNIHIREANEPLMVWIEQWLTGALSPRELKRLGPDFAPLTEPATEHTMVSPKQDIRVDGATKESAKHLGGWAASSILKRLDNEDERHRPLQETTTTTDPVTLGRLVVRGRATKDAATFPLTESGHTYISGKTGSGKSYMSRVLIEEAAAIDGIDILVFDPRNQAVGLLMPEDRESILNLYGNFGMKPAQAKGFDFIYHAPGQNIGDPIPHDPTDLASGRRIVSLKGLDDADRCDLFADILGAVFEHGSRAETESLRQLVVVEEAHRFTRKRIDDEAKASGVRAEQALDVIAREGRKYGIALAIVSQTIRDFSYDAASIRQNTNTKVFLHNSDREVDYAADFLGDGRRIVQLRRATALIHNPAWGVAEVRVRPPYSKVWEYGPEQTRELIDGPVEQPTWEDCVARLSEDAARLLDVVHEAEAHGNGPLNLTEAARRVGLTSKRRVRDCVAELEAAELVQTRKLPERGQPRVIEPRTEPD